MLANLKRILRTQYIGAIISGYLGAQGVIAIVSIIVYLFGVLLLGTQDSVINSRVALEWPRVINESLRALLYLLLVVGMIRWLYVESNSPPQPEISIEENHRETDEVQ